MPVPDHDRVTRLLDEPAMTERAKFEDYLLPTLGIRPVGLLTYPAEFPDAADLGRNIDARFASRYFSGGDPQLPLWTNLANRLRYAGLRAIHSPVGYKTTLLREVVATVLSKSASYRAALEWARRLGLGTYETEVRPSIRELYLLGHKPARERLTALMELREGARQEARTAFRPGMPAILYVYPEERSADYVRGMGALLGYPECCVDAYYQGRMRGLGEPETRAAEALGHAGGEGDPLAYFVRDFFPCRPSCAAALRVGHLALQRLREADPRLGDRYLALVQANRERVRAYPEILRAHAEGLHRSTGEVPDDGRE